MVFIVNARNLFIAINAEIKVIVKRFFRLLYNAEALTAVFADMGIFHLFVAIFAAFATESDCLFNATVNAKTANLASLCFFYKAGATVVAQVLVIIRLFNTFSASVAGICPAAILAKSAVHTVLLILA